MDQQPEPPRTLPPADAPARRPGEFDVNDPVPAMPGLPPAPIAPRSKPPRWRIGAGVAVALLLLLVGVGVFVQQRRSSDDGTAVLGTSVERATTGVTTSTLGTAPAEGTGTSVAEDPVTEDSPPTPPAAHPGTGATFPVSGVVRVTWLVADAAVAADPSRRPPSTCGEVTEDYRVRIVASPEAGGADLVSLSDRGEAFRGQFDGIIRVVCDFTYAAELSSEAATMTFELLPPTGEAVDTRQVSAEDVAAGVGPFLGHLIAAG